MRIRPLLPGLAVLAFVAGCSSKPVKVSGTVTLENTPLPGVLVTFHPASPSARPASAVTDAEGRFDLTSLQSADGAFPGEYRATVAVLEHAPQGESLADFNEMVRENPRPSAKKGGPVLHSNYGRWIRRRSG